MDKKSYIKPMMEVVELDSKVLMNSSSRDEMNLNDRFVTEDEQMARGRRGKWGNLWYEE